MSIGSTVWNAPGRIWDGALRAASITVWMRFGASLVVSLGIGSMAWIIWKGPWTDRVEAARLDWLGWALLMLIFTQVICIVALFDFRLNFRASRQGIEANMAGEEDPAPLEVKTTTTTTVTAPGDGELPADQRVKV